MTTLGDIDAIVAEKLLTTRPASQLARTAAINRAHRQGIDAIIEVRPDFFLQDDVVVLPANQLRVPLTTVAFPAHFTNPVIRIVVIAVLGSNAPTLDGTIVVSSDRVIEFERKEMAGLEFQAAMVLRPGNASTKIFYDLIFPSGVPTLAFAPALGTTVTALVSTIFDPARLSAPADPIQPILGDRFRELLIAGAMAWLLRDVSDTEAGKYDDEATLLQAKLATAVSTVSDRSQSMGSDLYGLNDVP